MPYRKLEVSSGTLCREILGRWRRVTECSNICGGQSPINHEILPLTRLKIIPYCGSDVTALVTSKEHGSIGLLHRLTYHKSLILTSQTESSSRKMDCPSKSLFIGVQKALEEGGVQRSRTAGVDSDAFLCMYNGQFSRHCQYRSF